MHTAKRSPINTIIKTHICIEICIIIVQIQAIMTNDINMIVILLVENPSGINL